VTDAANGSQSIALALVRIVQRRERDDLQDAILAGREAGEGNRLEDNLLGVGSPASVPLGAGLPTGLDIDDAADDLAVPGNQQPVFAAGHHVNPLWGVVPFQFTELSGATLEREREQVLLVAQFFRSRHM